MKEHNEKQQQNVNNNNNEQEMNFFSLKLLRTKKIIVWKIIHFHKHCAFKLLE